MRPAGRGLDSTGLIGTVHKVCQAPEIFPYFRKMWMWGVMAHSGAWLLIGRFFGFCPKGRWFESRRDFDSGSNRHVETLSKFLAHNTLHYNCICAAAA